jgi:hypothetical protein
VGGFFLAMMDEAFKFVRARYNTQGTIVHGFALYEKNLPIPRGMEAIVEPLPKNGPGWEFMEFYQQKIECEFWRSRKQSSWEDERERKLRTKPEEKPIWLDDELPRDRYRCSPSGILYRAGQGWGLF